MTIETFKGALCKIRDLLKLDKKRTLLLCGALVLLAVLLLPGGRKREKAAPEAQPVETAQMLEARLSALLADVEGVGDVRVMLHTAASAKTVYAVNTDDSAETRDTQTSRKEKSSVVILKTGQGEAGLAEQTVFPAVTGAAVVCRGGGDPVVRERVVQTLRALFGLSTHQISVMPM